MSSNADLAKSQVDVFNSFKIKLIAFLFIYIYIRYASNEINYSWILINKINFLLFHNEM